MDEQLSIAIWVIMAILAINFTLIWLDNNSEVFHTGISQNTLFDSIKTQVTSSETQNNNYASGNVILIAIQVGVDFSNAFLLLLQTIITLYVGWVFVLSAIFLPWGEIGLLFLFLILPVPLLIQAAATASLLWKMAVALKSVIPI